MFKAHGYESNLIPFINTPLMTELVFVGMLTYPFFGWFILTRHMMASPPVPPRHVMPDQIHRPKCPNKHLQLPAQ